ncbi:MAG: LysM peptidoglycan-binding domain-containing protein [Bacilli bacterium]|nr:LysM peptidoglycan-binding domain-containing protein [Bacilli bacterium]
MKQIIPFKKDLPFKTKVSDITSISLERKIEILDGGIVTGTFYITGDYKMNEGSINREKFSFDLPFDITLDPRYDVNSVKADIEDFYYDIINEDTLKVNIDLYIEAEYLPDTSLDNNILTEEDKSDNEMNDVQKEDDPVEEDRNIMMESKSDSKNDENIEIEKDKEVTSEKIKNDDATMNDSDIERNDVDDFANDLFSNLDNTETYTTYYVYIVKEEDTIDKIISLYGVTKEDIENYNDITSIKPGDKVIIPKTSE